MRHLEQLWEKGEEDPVPGEVADAILYAVGAHTKTVDVEELPLPDVPEDAAWSEMEDWTAGKMRRCIAAIAVAERTDPRKLLAAALRSESLTVIKMDREVESLKAELERKRCDKLLPPSKTLEKVARYEAHLSRELYRALHELEAMQARRQGQAAPLVRVETHGLPES